MADKYLQQRRPVWGKLCCECDPFLFVYQFIFIQLVFLLISLFLNLGFLLFLEISMSCFLSSQSFLCQPSLPALHHSHFCLSLHHPLLCPCFVIILFPVSLFPLLISSVFFINILIFLSIHLSVSFSQVAEQISG